jgi:hypothetical protein
VDPASLFYPSLDMSKVPFSLICIPKNGQCGLWHGFLTWICAVLSFQNSPIYITKPVQFFHHIKIAQNAFEHANCNV